MNRPATGLLFSWTLALTACNADLPVAENGSDGSSSSGTPALSVVEAGFVETSTPDDDAPADAQANDATVATTDAITDAGLVAFCDGKPCPPVVAEAEAEAGPPAVCDGGLCVLASGLDTLYGITVDSENVYVAGASSVFKCPLAGCGDSMTVLGGGAWGIAVASGVAYWTWGMATLMGGVVAKDLKSDAGPTTLAAGAYLVPYAIATNGTTVYWLLNPFQGPGGNIVGCAAGDLDGSTIKSYVGSSAGVVGGSFDPFGLAATSGQLFFAEWGNNLTTDSVGACPVSGCGGAGPTALAASPNSTWAPDAAGAASVPDAIVADGTNVYFTQYGPYGGSVLKCNVANCVQPTIIASGLAGGLAGLALDGLNLYWANQGDGTVVKCSVNGCPQPIVVASGQNKPYGVAVDSTSVYWTNQGSGNRNGDGAVMKAPK